MRTRLAALALAAALTGCGNDTPEPAAAPAGPTPASSSSTSTPATDPLGRDACADVKATNAANGFEPDLPTLAAIADQGARAQEGFVRIAAQALSDAVKLAVAAAGADDEGRMRLSAATRAIEMETECTRAGY